MNLSLKIEENVPLAPFTTLGIGGRSRFFVRADSEEQVADALEFANSHSLKVFVLGGGSNVVIADSGFDGLVVQIAINGIKLADTSINDRVEVTASAGEDWDQFVAFCVENSFAGVECLSGIPGFVGGTPVQNVGAYGQEVANTIVEVRCFDRLTTEFVIFSNSECSFSYRTSMFNSTHRDRYIVLAVSYSLIRNGEPKLTYKDLIDCFIDRRPTLKDVRDAVLRIRRTKSMVIDIDDPNSKSVGSFFKNPVMDVNKFLKLKAEFPNMPHFEFGEMVKVPAAWLIETSGFNKGFAINNVGISSNHTLAIINRGDSTSTEILHLAGQIQLVVAAKFGIDLQPEPVFVGL